MLANERSKANGASDMCNALTIDVEDYFQVSAFAAHIPRDSWSSHTCRVERNIDLILGLLDASGHKATFFILGWIAERYPAMVWAIQANGHEVASHGYGHLRITEQSVLDFTNDINSSKHILEDLCGKKVLGYRAPSFSIGKQTMWALDVLLKAGYRYSSSIYPVRHDHYGIPDAPRFSYYPNGSEGLLELPISTVRLFHKNVPAGGGGYFRLYPYAMTHWLLRHINQTDQQPGIFYFHPWELDPEQPRQKNVGIKTRFRHYVNLSRTEPRLKALFRDFRWDRVDRVFLADSPKSNRAS